MKTGVPVLILALASIVLSACVPLYAAQPTAQPQRTEVTRGSPTATEGPQLLTNGELGGTVMRRADDPESSVITGELAGNLFDVLLGPVQTPDGCSVRPCSGEAPLLCVYQGRTLLGTVDVETSLLSGDLCFRKILNDATISLGSTDYTDPENAPLVHRALAAHAAPYLADLAQERELTYLAKGHTFAPVAPEEIRVGNLPGVAYGFTGHDQDGRVFERWLTYAALDNDTLYLFGMFYADGVPESFLSDEDLVHFEPYLRQILARLRLPASEDWHSPGAELPQGPRLVVQRPDDSVHTVTLDGLSAILVAEAPSSLLPAGYGGVPSSGTAMTDGPIVYVRQWFGGFYALDTILGQLFPLDFVPPPSPVAVRPLTEGLLPEGAPMSLAWGEFSAGYEATARLYLSAPDGSQAAKALEETCGASDTCNLFVPWRWREDGRLYFAKQPVEGMGGFRAFVGAANLWLLDPQSGESVELVSRQVTGGKLCVDAISTDDRRVVHHCDEGEITILNLESGEATPFTLPDQATSDMQLGSVRFSPDGSRLAFAVLTGGYERIEETWGYVAVSDNLGLRSRSHVIATSEPGEWFSVVDWLSDDRLVLQSHNAGPDGWPAVWIAQVDGSGLVKLAEGTFLAKFDG